jgi:hypothetical protein
VTIVWQMTGPGLQAAMFLAGWLPKPVEFGEKPRGLAFSIG